MKLSALTTFGFYINGALGTEKYNDISIQEVKTQLKNYNLFPFLEERLGRDVFTSHFSSEDKKEIADAWLDMSISIDESKKLCVEKNGLALITAYILESIQRIDFDMIIQNKAKEYLNNSFPQVISSEQNIGTNTDGIVKIGIQEWMAENLNVDCFRNGDKIQEAQTDDEWDEAVENGKPVWCHYENDLENEEKYGKLYNWHAVKDPRGLAPEGFHIPTKVEFAELVTSVGKHSNALKAIGQGIDDGAGTNVSGFSALLGGYREEVGNFYELGENAFIWSSTETNKVAARTFHLYDYDNKAEFVNKSKNCGCSVRCIKD